LKIALDVDGVLANFWAPFSAMADIPLPTDSWSSNHKNFGPTFEKIKNDKEFWGNLPIITNPNNIDFEITAYVTSLPPEMKSTREAWLKANGFPDAPVIVADDKLPVLKELGIDVFVDDKPSTCDYLQENGIMTMQYIPYYVNVKTYCPSTKANVIFHISEVTETLALWSFAEKQKMANASALN